MSEILKDNAKGKSNCKKGGFFSLFSEEYSLNSILVNLYLAAMFIIFPLYYTQQYSNIRHDKYDVFLVLSALLVVGEVFLLFALASKGKAKDNISAYKTLTTTDYAMLALLLVYVVSTIFSAYREDAFTGEAGRNNGCLIMIVYVAVYFIITREFSHWEYLFAAFALGSGIVFLLAVLNFYYIDPLNMYVGYEPADVENFSSTIGNKNLVSSFICVCLPALMLLFMNTKSRLLSAIYFIAEVLGFSALMVSDSDSGFVGFFALLLLVLVYYIRKPNYMFKYFLSLFSMLLGAKVLFVFSVAAQGKVKELSSIPSFFVYTNGLSFVLILLTLILCGVFFIISRKNAEALLPKAVFYAAAAVVAACFLAVVYMIIKYTFIDTTSELNGISSYFRFDDKWGTHRGYIWRKSFEIFLDANIKDKLIGCGPDTLVYPFTPFFAELASRFGNDSTNCAHNEYLNYLVTTGILGLAAYLAVIASFIVRAVKYAKHNPLIIVCAGSVICYSIQAIANITQPITTPLFILMLCIGEALCRQCKNKNTAANG